jgi:quinol monooxygenase YgiN
MEQLQVSARFPRVDPTRLSEFKAVASEVVAQSRNEPGTLSFTLFMNADETVGVFREVYTDSNAVLTHLAAAGASIGKLAELGGGIEIECFGAPSAELMTATAAMSPAVFRHVVGK